ncbi:subtilase family protein [Novosphingobium sp. PhB55]|uniref:S8 family serine peptidase n=1 Tax=Novosphingobium sp. PhB55 TaxID=2485106 RepID=UPI00106691A2|nr:S8 family serine peptidase [Novosphingobium sp. PhB55]TDW68996.1 subtilase family protein [Novosphingobium sp. PhB55]
MPGPLDRLTKLDSRLRCVANGATEVNAIRAEQNGAVRLKPKARAKLAPATVLPASGETLKSFGLPLRAAKRGAKQTELPNDVEVSVFVLLNRIDAPTPGMVTRRNGRVGVATATLAQLARLDDNPDVQLIELGETLRAPTPSIALAVPPPPPADRHAALNSGKSPGHAGPFILDGVGENVLVGIIDVGGIDFAHPDFLDDNGASRVIAVWDQGGDAFEPPKLSVIEDKAGRTTGYGSEIRASDISFAMKEAAASKLSPHDLAPQSVRERGSHATHVASIAAGRSGLCKRAKIAAVMIALGDAGFDRGKSFYDTTRIVDGLAYLFDLARREKFDGISINISLGTNGGAHDGSEFVSRWIDTSMFEPGRAIAVAAGNSGQDQPQFDGDIGFWSGRVHASGQIVAANLRTDLEWVVVGNGLEDISENQMAIWYGAEDEFVVTLFAPDGQQIGPVAPGEHIENTMLADRTIVSIYNRLSDPKNGENCISVYLSPFMGRPVIGITAGSWKVRLTGKVIRNGQFNAWIERDDPARGTDSQWRLPSFFGAASYVDQSTLSSLACGPRVTGVTNYDAALEKLAATSSQGPTRDGRSKPEIAAPGTDIVAACGFDPEAQWISMSGTSMASPYVAGVSALMLSLNPKLTAAQISGIIRRTSQPLPGASYAWTNDAGFGVINAAACLAEAVRIGKPTTDLTKKGTA